jgi:CheY-like chemotaxis protein
MIPAKEIKELGLVALTGDGQAEDRDRAFSAGFDRHLTKPISHDRLRDVLLHWHAQSVCMSRDKRYT